jgi:hypothetical protein
LPLDENKMIPIYFANGATLYKERGLVPRLGCGMLKIALDHCFEKVYG